ncbi:carbohydrate porin [Marinobacter alexandrii]|uniref:carbohydrate porin n=1 Tax=Marinobacter alexandrii TaxID=2570351 RepID=UPI00329891D9
MLIVMRPLFVAAVLLCFVPVATAQEQGQKQEQEQEESQSSECSPQNLDACDEKTLSKWRRWLTVAAPDQVERRLRIDSLPGDPLLSAPWADKLQAKKSAFEEARGVSWSVDYINAYLYANESLGDKNAAAGVLRFMGVWEAMAGDGGNSGALVWKAEHRHAYGDHVSPQAFGNEIGYAGLPHLTLSDQGGRLTNLYWRQRFRGGDTVLLAGWLDTSDYVDVYTLASPWTDFFNYVFSTGGASMAVPNEGLGAAIGGYLTENIYAIGGFADANSDPANPLDGVDTFFNQNEYFKHFDVGWNSSRETAFLNNFHVSLWQQDERKEAGVEEGWGANFSWSQLIDKHWTVFLRGGFSEDGGAILEETVSTGFAWARVPGGNKLGIGLNWGVPMDSTYGPDLPEQTTLEAYYRIQVFRDLALTPDIQYLRNPALNPSEDAIWVLGLRARLVF